MFNFLQKKNLSLGQLGEKVAVEFLKKRGYLIVCTNFTNKKGRRIGEIDIIAKDKDEFVFVEVKTRKETPYQLSSNPEENINHQKLHKLQKIATFYIKNNNLWDSPYRFDGISLIYNEKTRTFKIKHLKNIFL